MKNNLLYNGILLYLEAKVCITNSSNSMKQRFIVYNNDGKVKHF